MLDKATVKEFYQGLLICGEYSELGLVRQARSEFRTIIDQMRVLGTPKYDEVTPDLLRWAIEALDERSPREKNIGLLNRTVWEHLPDEVIAEAAKVVRGD